MPIFICREGECLRARQLCAVLGINGLNSAFCDAASQLKHATYLKTARAEAGNKDERPDEPWIQKEANSYTYSFSYVGILQYRENVVWILPKYCDITMHPYEDGADVTIVEQLKELLRVIGRYRKNCRDRGEKSQIDPWEEALQVAVELVQDYAEHGVYREDEPIEEINGGGRILWQRTIQTKLPFIQRNEPYYIELCTRRNQEDEKNYVTRLHRYLTHDAYAVLKKYHLTELLGLPLIPAPEDAGADLDETEYAKDHLVKELNVQFDSRKRYLLQLMLRYIDLRQERGSEGFRALGKSKFEVVWEEACREVFGMKRAAKNVMSTSRPVWCFSAKQYSGSALEADLYSYRNKELLIYDAKYYAPESEEKGLPGIQDVLKQHMYELALRNYVMRTYHEHPKKVYNVFLLPLREGEMSVESYQWGRVHMPLFSGVFCAMQQGCSTLSPIKLVKLLPTDVWKAYLTPEKRAKVRQQLLEILSSC